MTETEYRHEATRISDAILRAELIEPRLPAKSLRDIFADIKKYAEIGLKLLDVLAKYFFVNGKISAPSVFKIWIYFRLVGELYNLFKELKNEDSIPKPI
jgi:hypothetical protein